MKLRKLPEPAQSREFTGEAFREKLLFCLCKRSGVSTVASHTNSHQRLLLLLGFGERSFLSAPTWLQVYGWAHFHMH